MIKTNGRHYNMEIRILKNFLTIAKEGNITHAADILHLSQPSLSKQMMDLETELGKKLFNRGKRNTTLTEDGKHLMRRAEEIIELCEKTEKEMSQENVLVEGEISIAGAASPTVIKAISLLREEYPSIHFQISTGGADAICERLDTGTLDFAILIGPVDVIKYEHIDLCDYDDWGLMMHKNMALAEKSMITPTDIENIPLMLPQRKALQKEFTDWNSCESKKFNIIATYDILYSNPILLAMNKLGSIYTLRSLAETYKGSDLVFRPLSPAIRIQLGLVWKRNASMTRQARKFLDKIKLVIDNLSNEKNHFSS